MKCVCERACQVKRKDGKIVFYSEGEVANFSKCPAHFKAIQGKTVEPVDFMTAGEEELMEREFELNALKTFIEEEFGLKPGNRGKEKTVKMLLDARERKIEGLM